MSSRTSVVVCVGLFSALLANSAAAQSALAGVVKDASGGVMPGVTVEAKSPALIEKMRTAVTDGPGQYRIIDLRPGAYTVTFTLSGFNTVIREGIELQRELHGARSMPSMRVGALEESITVSGADAGRRRAERDAAAGADQASCSRRCRRGRNIWARRARR